MQKRNKVIFRDLNGILLLNKPIGLSSNAALQRARFIFRARKAGHTGSLDPQATGVLPLCFGEATKVSGFLLGSDKRYITTVQLGQTTTTGDTEGEILSDIPVTDISDTAIQIILDQFTGSITQIPPMFSALKHNGTPLYKLARKGIKVERKQREITIYELTLLNRTQDTLQLDVHCSKGTYIRTLAQDIGDALGFGAHITSLERTEVSPFDCSKLYTLEELQEMAEQPTEELLDSTLLPLDTAISQHPQIILSAEETTRVKYGLKVTRNDIPNAPLIRMYEESGEFIGIGRLSSDKTLAPKRLMRTN
ncbi:MAG TPA: tRNA pseudouridine(55) synthase TruB [Leucothrix mucor]|nr:tRNA pseudouridine(55) synthase TruB [Leucothrix mucor]